MPDSLALAQPDNTDLSPERGSCGQPAAAAPIIRMLQAPSTADASGNAPDGLSREKRDGDMLCADGVCSI